MSFLFLDSSRIIFVIMKNNFGVYESNLYRLDQNID